MKGAEEVDMRDRLLAYRADRGWSQARLVQESGVSGATIAHIETRANKRPRRITLMRLAQAFGVSLDEFLAKGLPKPPASRSAPALELAELFGADPKLRQRALAAASTAEVARYLADLDRALTNAGKGDEDDTPDTRRGLVEYASQLTRMRIEAEAYAPQDHAADSA